MKSLSPAQSRLLDTALHLRETGYEPEKAFVSREMVQATLPHKNPGDVPAWSRINGNYALTIQPGWDSWQKQSFGYPYGTIPRLLIFWLTTEALRTGNRHVELGDHLADFMRKLGLDSSRGGVRSDAHRLREQMERLFRARISFEYRDAQQQSWLDMQIAPRGMQWWGHNLNEQPTLWENWVELGEEFYKAITAHPVPVNMDALQALKKSPLALDLYAWLTHQAFRASSSHRSRRITWRALHEQLGADYADVQNFRRKVIEAIRKIENVYPGLQLETIEGGLSVKPSSPAIPSKTLILKAENTVAPPSASPVPPIAGKVSPGAIETAKALVLNSDSSWDIYALEHEFYEYAGKKGQPKYLDKAFIGFVQKKIAKKA
jgi:Plasmid encoded RepA protein